MQFEKGEPVYDPSVDENFTSILNWYTLNKSDNDAKTYFLTYLERDYGDETLFNKAKSYSFTNSVAWAVRIKERAKNLKEKDFARIYSAIYTTIQEIQKYIPNTEPRTYQRKETCEEIIQLESLLDDFIDNKPIADLKEYITSSGWSRSILEKIESHFLKTLKEISEATEYTKSKSKKLTEEQQQLVEAYEYLGKKLPVYRQYLDTIVSTSHQLAQASGEKKGRKPRKVSPEKLVKKLRFKQEDETLKVKSISPVKIIGASCLLVYNSKTRNLGMYMCSNDKGLSVKGNKISNFDPKVSSSKILRNPEEQLSKFLSGTLAFVKNEFQSIKAKEKELNGVLNYDTVLLRMS